MISSVPPPNWKPVVANVPPKSANWLPERLVRGDAVCVHPEGLKAAGVSADAEVGVVSDLLIEAWTVRALVRWPGAMATVDVRYLTLEE